MSDATHQRRWYRFSLKTLLMFVLVASVSSGWIGAKILRERERRARVQRIQEITIELKLLETTLGKKWPSRDEFPPLLSDQPPLLSLLAKTQADHDDEKSQQDSPQCEILP